MTVTHPLSLRSRLALGAVAFLGTAIYAASFLPNKTGHPMAAYATGVGISAAVSWLILGTALLILSRSTPGRLQLWFDTCLISMAYGEAILLLAALVNLLSIVSPEYAAKPSLGVHLALLLTADTVMAACFVTRARRFGVPPKTSLALWILVLNGSFALLMLALACPLGYA